MTIPELTAAAAERFGDSLAVVDGDERLTYRGLLDRARSFGAALVATDVRTGDTVAIWAPNGVRWIIAALGTWQAGAVVVPVNTRFKGREAADILRRSRARVLVTVTDFLGVDYVELLRQAGEEPELVDVVVPGTWLEFLGRADTCSRAEAERRAAAVSGADGADILFTSGTTGTPKGVVHTHRSTLGVATDFVAEAGLVRGDRYLMVNPYFHMFGLKAGILAALAAGATMLPEPVFDVERALRRVAEDRVTALPGPPTIYQAILDHPDRDRFDLTSLRVAVTGAADIPVELIRRMQDELPFDAVVTGYGLTEAGTATSTGPGDDAETIASTVGRPRPGFEIRIAGDGGAPRATGEVGEVLLRGPTTMARYLDDPEATAAAFTDDGWLRTGDLGVLDERGYLRIVGRSKDMFIVGGFNAYPAEIEDILRRHPGIRDVAVVGMPDDRLGEVGMAFVVTRPGGGVSGPEIVDWARAEMANYKVPRAVELVDELPTNATGKVVKDELRARAAGPAAVVAAEPSEGVTMTSDEVAPGERFVQDLLDREVRAVPVSLRATSRGHLDQVDIAPARYFDPAFHRLEVARLWSRTWQMACREEQIPEVGDSIIYEIGDASLIVVRTAPDEIRAFHNSCLHRGTQLRTKPGHVTGLRCPYHGFTWNIDGTLRDVPCEWDFPQIERETFCLPEAQLGTWGGFVFVNLDAHAPPLEDHLEDLPWHFQDWPLEDRYLAAHIVRVMPCNWKVALEAFIEAFHTMATHPQLLTTAADTLTEYDVYGPHVSRMITAVGVGSEHLDAEPDDAEIVRSMLGGDGDVAVPAGSTARQVLGDRVRASLQRRTGRDYSGLTDAEALDGIEYFLFPNFMPWGGLLTSFAYRFRPQGHDPDSCVIDIMLLQPVPEGEARPPAARTRHLGADESWADVPELGAFGRVFNQDGSTFGRVQRGLRASVRPTITLGRYQESRIRHFHATLDVYLGRPEDAS